MTEIDTTFFSGKRPWSKIKDKVLSEYMPAYLRKVATLGKDILLIDGYAGPGEFDDNTHGSPLIRNMSPFWKPVEISPRQLLARQKGLTTTV